MLLCCPCRRLSLTNIKERLATLVGLWGSGCAGEMAGGRMLSSQALICVVFLFHPSDARTCGLANCQYGCEVLKGEVRCQCPSPGLQLAADGRTCVGRSPISPHPTPPPPGMTSEPNVTVPSREQLVRNPGKNVVFALLFAALTSDE